MSNPAPSPGDRSSLPTGTPVVTPAIPPLSAAVNLRYVIEGILGEGGMGTVYRARDQHLNRVVALKVIRLDALTTEMRARFHTEAKTVAALDHPHIIKIFDVGEEFLPDGLPASPHLALEYVPGGTLAQALKQGRLLGPDHVKDAARVVGLLARAMQHAHERGVVHRDLKPDNVLLAPPSDVVALNSVVGCPKITDFGLARQLAVEQRHTRTGFVMGTPRYMAPEQAEGKLDVGPAADVWALGVILYECLTGRPPFHSASITELLYLICHAPTKPMRHSGCEVPIELEHLCLDCLAKDPLDRPSVKDMSRELERLLEDYAHVPPIAVRVATPNQPLPVASAATPSPGQTITAVEHPAPRRDAKAHNRGRPGPGRFRWRSLAAFVAVVGIAALALMLWRPGDKMGKERLALPGPQGITEKDAPAQPGLNEVPQPGKHEEYVVTLAKGVTLRLARIPGTKDQYPKTGTFTMGSPKGEPGRKDEKVKHHKDEELQHEVAISPFYLGVTEVTQAQFRAVMGYNPSVFSNTDRGNDPRVERPRLPGQMNKLVAKFNTDKFPVENVFYAEALEFVAKLNQWDNNRPKGHAYRLPREAEWEYACRGGVSQYQTFHFGNSLSPKQANIDMSLGRTTTVGSYEPNRFGLYDMHGNVWEWCQDWFDEEYYNKSPQLDPPGPLGPRYTNRVVRGGSYLHSEFDCRSAFRHNYPQTTTTGESVGIRVALGLAERK